MPVTSIFKERFVRGQRPAHNLQFPAGLKLAEAVAGFSNYFWPGSPGRPKLAKSWNCRFEEWKPKYAIWRPIVNRSSTYTNRARLKMRAILTIALLLIASDAWSLGFESFGNDPVEGSNYTEWPNVLPLVNDPHRVYFSWVNGNEHFYFAGDNAALNAALKSFSAIKAKKLTVVLRPAPGTGSSLKRDREFEFNWNLHLLGGIAKVMSREDLGTNIWDPTPYLHIYVGDGIKLDEIEIPDGVEVLEIADLKTRYAKCLASKDRTVRGWCCSHIAGLDPYDEESVRQIASKLNDDDDWVKLNAVVRYHFSLATRTK